LNHIIAYIHKNHGTIDQQHEGKASMPWGATMLCFAISRIILQWLRDACWLQQYRSTKWK